MMDLEDRAAADASPSSSSPSAVRRGYDSPTLHLARQEALKDVDVNRSAVMELLNLRLGSLTPEQWIDAEQMIMWWSVQRSGESVRLSFALLERILQEQMHHQSSSSSSTLQTSTAWESSHWLNADLLNRILNNWRVVWWEQHEQLDYDTYSPRSVRKTIEQYLSQYNFPMNEKSMYLILEAEVTRPTDVQSPSVPPAATLHTNHNKNHATPEFAHEILDGLIQRYQETDVTDFLPSTELFNLVMKAWLVSGRIEETAAKCETLCELMQQLHVPVNVRTCRRIIHAHVATKSLEGMTRAQDRLLRMHTEYLVGNEQVRPDSAAVATVIAGWSQSGAPDAGQKAIHLYQTFEEYIQYNKVRVINSLLTCLSRSNRKEDIEEVEQLFWKLFTQKPSATDTLSPDATTYLILISAAAKLRRPDKAEAALQRLLDAGVNGQLDMNVTNEHVTTVVSAWARSNHPNKVKQINALLAKMEALSRSENNDNLQPSLETYNALLSCYTDGQQLFAGSQAEKILMELQARALAGDKRYLPDKITYTTVIKALARHGLSERALRVLDEMYNDFQSGNEKARPDLMTYNTVLTSFAKEKRAKDGAVKAAKFFETMKELATSGFIDKLDAVSYSSLIHACANSKQGERNVLAEAAEKAFRDMQAAYKKGNESLQPTHMLYNGLLNVWAKAGRPDRAGDILREMYLDFQGGNLKARPDVTSFNTLIKALAFSKLPEAGEQAEEIVQRMKTLHESGALDVRPNAVTYSSLVLAHVLSRQDGSLERAEAILRLMDKLYQKGELNQGATKQAYDSIRRGWSSLKTPEGSRRCEILRTEIDQRFDGQSPSEAHRGRERKAADS
jgi:pentatricopeptide repeat protein